jgi:Mg/Co/Ni transporter MgtE
LNKNLNTINDEKIKEELEKKVENEFTYLLKRIPDEKKEEVLEKKQEALKPESISKLIESLKVETTFAIFEKSVINKTIEKNS